MMRILIIASEVARSPITFSGENEGPICDLPEKLQNVVLETLNVFTKCEVTEVLMDGEQNLYIVRTGQNYTLRNNTLSPFFLLGMTSNALIETIALLHWHLSPHMRACDPGTLGGTIVCCECGHTQQTGRAYSKYCEVPECASHAKWAEICEGYEVPKRQESPLAKMVRSLCIKQVSSAPTIGNSPNSWAEKC